jgi:hypothetical protein
MTARCELDKAQEFQPSYASVLYCGQDSLEAQVHKLETTVWPSLTSWCSKCEKPCLITVAVKEFPTISAHHIHQLATWKRMQNLNLF